MGVGPATIGALIASMSIVAVVARPLGGRLSDVGGRRAAAALGGFLCAVGAGLLLVPAAPAVVWPARAAVGVGEALVTTACMAWIVDMVPVERRGRALSWFGISFWLGISIGPQIARARARARRVRPRVGTAAACSLAAVLLFNATPDSPVRGSPRRDPVRAAARGPRPRHRASGCACSARASSPPSASPTSWGRGPRGRRRSAARRACTRCSASPALLVRPLIAPLPDRYGGRTCALVGCALLVGGLAAIAVASSFGVAAVGAAAMGVALARSTPSLAMLVAAAVEPERRGLAMGGFMSFLDIGLAVGAIAAGLVVGAASTTAAFAMAAVAAGLSAVLIAARAPTHAQERAPPRWSSRIRSVRVAPSNCGWVGRRQVLPGWRSPGE